MPHLGSNHLIDRSFVFPWEAASVLSGSLWPTKTDGVRSIAERECIDAFGSWGGVCNLDLQIRQSLGL